jgi:hypothetical protein
MYISLQKHNKGLFTYEVYENDSTGHAMPFTSAAGTNATQNNQAAPYCLLNITTPTTAKNTA